MFGVGRGNKWEWPIEEGLCRRGAPAWEMEMKTETRWGSINFGWFRVINQIDSINSIISNQIEHSIFLKFFPDSIFNKGIQNHRQLCIIIKIVELILKTCYKTCVPQVKRHQVFKISSILEYTCKETFVKDDFCN